MEYRRRIASALALEYGAPETAKTIRSLGSCWGDIFRTAEREMGIPKLFTALKKAGRPEWIDEALDRISFTPRQNKGLSSVLLARYTADRIHKLFYSDPEASKNIVIVLEKYHKKTAAREIFNCGICRSSLTPRLRERLKKLAAS